MRILMCNTTDRSGGAARVVDDLAIGLRSGGHHVDVLVGDPSSELHNPTLGGRGFVGVAERRYLRAAATKYGYEDYIMPSSWFLRFRSLFRLADVVHFHNLHGGYFNLRALPWLAKAKPSVLTLHDAWALTGHCAQPLGCDGWRDTCGDCPSPTHAPAMRVSAAAAAARRKRRIFPRVECTVVVPSTWLDTMVGQSSLSAHRRVVVPNGVDLETFRPTDKAAARDVLGLPQGRSLVLFYVDRQDYIYKGPIPLRCALALLAKHDQTDVVLVGSDENVNLLKNLHPRVHHVRALRDSRLSRIVLAAVDVLATSSVGENAPLSLLESLACGTPAVGFDIGGQSEIILDGHTGRIVSGTNGEDLANAVVGLLELETNQVEEMSRACRSRAIALYGTASLIQSYESIYTQLATDRGDAC